MTYVLFSAWLRPALSGDTDLACLAERAGNCIKQACEGGALRFLRAGLLQSVPFEDDFPAQRELYAQAIHQLLMTFLDAEPGRSALGVDLLFCLAKHCGLAKSPSDPFQGRGGSAVLCERSKVATHDALSP